MTEESKRVGAANLNLTAAAILLIIAAVAYVLNPVWALKFGIIHTLLEIVCVAIAFTSFCVIWFSAKLGYANIVLAIGFLAVAIFDTFHVVFWQGLGLFPLGYFDLGARYWVLGRITEALFLIVSTTNWAARLKDRVSASLITLAVTTLIGILVYQSPHLFPVLLTPNGVTPIKIVLEYIIIFMFIIFLYRVLKGNLYRIIQQNYMVLAIMIAIPSELCFTFFSTFDYLNLLGHLLRLVYYYLLLRAVVEGFIVYPYRLLERSEDRFQKIFNNSPVMKAIYSYNSHKYLDVNQEWLETCGYKREEFLDQTWSKVNIFGIHWFFWEERVRSFPLSKEHISFRCKDGTIREGIMSSQNILLNDDPCALMVIMDTTEQEKQAREILRLDRLNIIGQMAASIAHEIRNPMTSVRGFLQLFHDQEKYQEDKEDMDLIIEELDRVNDIVTTFLSIAQKNNQMPRCLSINDIIKTLLPLLTADALKNDVNIKTELNNIAPAMVDEGEIRQLLLNLVRNGIQAMVHGGSLIIKTYQDKSGVNLLVKDEGTGIPEELLDKIGTPFFTTKESGSGLGLAVCYSIAERHNAKIKIDTSSAGTSFNVIFPMAG